MCRLRNIALESVTEKCDRPTDGRTDRQATDVYFYALHIQLAVMGIPP